MNNSKEQGKQFFYFKIIQRGENIKIPLIEKNINKEFREIYYKLLKELKLKEKNAFLSNEDGKMIGISDLSLSLEEVIKKFGFKLRLYYEKVF